MALTNFAIPGRAIYDGMYEVKPGHVVRVSRDGLSTRCYWKLEAHEHEDSLDTTIKTVREHMERIIRQQTVADVPLCSLLSGGLDSSFVTAMADRVVRERNGDAVRSYSVDFTDHGAEFVQDAQRGTSDTPFVREFVKQMRTQHTEVVLDNAQLASRAVRRAVMEALDNGWSAGGDMYPSLYLLFADVRKTSTVALSGEAADEVFGGYRWFHIPEAVNAATFPWMYFFPSFTSVLSQSVLKELSLAEYEADSYSQAINAVPALPGQTGHEKRMREVCFLNLTNWLPILLDRKDRMSMAVGLEVRVPFCDHELVQYVFNTPWSMKTFDGREKSLLRAAAKDIVPKEILQRVKSPYPATQDPAYERALRLQMQDFIPTSPQSFKKAFDEVALRGLIDKPLGATSIGWERGDIDHALAIGDWLEGYNVELSV
jgi:asparagine synthase (glutamine-hydrolysing)